MPAIESPGKYAVTVTSAFFDQTQKGTPYLGLGFATEDGLTITGYLWLSQEAAPGKKSAFAITDETLRKAFGFNGDYTSVEPQLKGKPASIEVADETYNGKTSLKVRFINAPRAEMSDKASFLASLTKASKALAAAPKTSAKTAGDDTDVPF